MPPMQNKPQPTPPAPPTSGRFQIMGAPARWCITNDVLIVERLALGQNGGADTWAEIFIVPVDGILAAVRAARS